MAAKPTIKSAGRKTGRAEEAVLRKKKSINELVASIEATQQSTSEPRPFLATLRNWLLDESGYDEENWPKLKRALRRERKRVGAEDLFHG